MEHVVRSIPTSQDGSATAPRVMPIGEVLIATPMLCGGVDGGILLSVWRILWRYETPAAAAVVISTIIATAAAITGMMMESSP